MKKIFLTVVFFMFSLDSFAELSPTHLNFDSQALNSTSAEQQVTLENGLRDDLNITDITVSGDFAQTNDCGNSVASRASCTISITFTPTTAGTHNKTLTVTSDSSDSPEQVTLTGVGEESIPENQKPTAAFTITPDSGEAPLTVELDASTSTDPDGDETIQNYQWVSSDNQSISEGKTASVTFDTQGSYTITLTITDDKGETDTQEETVTVNEKTVEKFSLEIKETNGTVKCSIDDGTKGSCQTQYDKETSLTLTAEPDTNFEFTGWSGDCLESGECQITMDADKKITANFSKIEQPVEQTVEKFTLEITETNGGTVKCSINRGENSDCQSEYDAETSLTLTAVPDTNFEFTGWSGDCPESGDCQITMNADKSITANFSEVEQPVEKFSLEINATNGTVKCSIDGETKGSCQTQYDKETSLTITAEPDTNFEFTGWSGDCPESGDCQITMNADKSITANFSEVEQPDEQTVEKFSLEITETNGGTVKCSVNGERENGDCQTQYDEGTSLTLTAEPDTGFEFTDWSGDCSGSATNCQLIMDANKTVNAEFEATDKQKPIASFTTTMDSDNLLKVDLNASGSSDDGTITSYEWTSTDAQSISDGKTTSVTFDKAGSYEITLTVTNDNGKTDTDTQTVITGYPLIEQVFSIDRNGEARTTTAQFYGGISVNNGPFVSELTNENNNLVKIGKDTIMIEGVIIPENRHTGQTEIIVVGLYTPNTETVEDRCNPANGDYYMLTDGPKTNHYCQWDVTESNEWCNDLNPTPRRRENTEYAIRWNGKLDSLQPLFTDVELIGGQPINLTAEKGSILYKDIPAYIGHVCLNFGYRLDGTIVFNGTPIEFDVIE